MCEVGGYGFKFYCVINKIINIERLKINRMWIKWGLNIYL